MKNDLNQGVVIARFGNMADVETEEGPVKRCHMRSHLVDAVCGDRVTWEAVGADSAVILNILPRKSLLSRQGARLSKPLAANVTHVFIVMAPLPLPSLLLLDSYLVAIEALHLTAEIIFNKVDMLKPAQKIEMQKMLTHYEGLGYPVHWISTIEKSHRHEFEKGLRDKTSIFVGQSGVGKSSIISWLIPNIDVSTGPLSVATQAGSHTTSTSRLYHLHLGGDVIDSPGIREFTLWHMPPEQITKGFREIAPLANACKFRNCHHQKETHCAVREAVVSGLLPESRYKHYLKILGT